MLSGKFPQRVTESFACRDHAAPASPIEALEEHDAMRATRVVEYMNCSRLREA